MKSLTRWEPFGTVKRWDPFEEMRSMQREMDRLFDRFLGVELPTGYKGVWMPSVECYTKEGKIVFRAELPGIDAKDLDVSISDGELVIKGERKHEQDTKEENYAYREISYGAFERHFALPEGVKTDELKAKFKDGILEVTVPAPIVSKAVSKARKIEIETSKEDKKLVEGESRKAA